MDEPQNWSGVLLGGFVGAIVGSLMTLGGQWLQIRSNRKGAARALRVEMERNGYILHVAAAHSTFPHDELSDATWLNVQTDIALLLGEQDFDLVATTYTRLPLIRSLATAGTSRDRLAKEMDDGSKEFKVAAGVLARRIGDRPYR